MAEQIKKWQNSPVRRRLTLATASLLLLFAVVNFIAAVKENGNG